MPEFIAVLCITVLAVISPGADFAVVTKNSYLYGRSIGILTALGIALGVLFHVSYALIIFNLALQDSSIFLNIIRYIGASYLIYIGYKTFIQTTVVDTNHFTQLSPLLAFKTGFLTNALNPKTALFVISIYTQMIAYASSVFIGYGLFIALMHFFWFTLVGLVFSQPTIRQKLLTQQSRINRIIGSILIILGLALLFSHLF
ncbi:LysE family translocator [Acinetobacter rudis]|uniref:LysE family transporter n=1 Tax=Acinetobacter rudis TaxID=632955 RepID=A0AAW8JDN6_9GAMM|nr:LysE family transporter [Acinetobacter rudis]MDQ8936948.1 LysE family transporter [Acinetobacter rudis]MDQ8954435.1 LysE family transporter [Acinetobacter rudis]MDQ9019168.1 LysE family transporter [Acinetobacter rudis]